MQKGQVNNKGTIRLCNIAPRAGGRERAAAEAARCMFFSIKLKTNAIVINFMMYYVQYIQLHVS